MGGAVSLEEAVEGSGAVPDPGVVQPSAPAEPRAVRRDAGDASGRREQRLRLALGAGRLGVWEWDRATDRVEWDAGMEAICHLPPGTFGGTVAAYVAVLHPEDRERVLAVAERAATEAVDFVVEHRLVRPDGCVRWVEGRGQPVWSDGEVTGLIGVSADVTERHDAVTERERLLAEESAARAAVDAARGRLELLAGATTAMAAGLDLEERLAALTRLVVPRFADACAVHLVAGDRVDLIAMHHRDGGRAAALGELLRRHPVRLDAAGGVGAAMREGLTGWAPTITDDLLVAGATSDEHLAALRSLELSGGVTVPLRGDDGVFGAVTFFTVAGRTMAPDDLASAEELCARVSVLIEHGRLLDEREADRAAQRYQAALLGSLVEASPDGIFAVGVDGGVIAHNQRFLDLWRLEPGAMGGGAEGLLAATEPLVVDAAAYRRTACTATEERPSRLRDEVVLHDGTVLDRRGSRLDDAAGEYLGFAWSFRDVTAERAQQAEIAAAGERFATLARTLQRSLLPPRLPAPVGIELAARYHPALAGVDVGGDFYDVFPVGSDWILVIGDVCGKGAEAAAMTALVRHTVRAASMHDSDPTTTLVELNAAMLATTTSADDVARFATVCCVRLRPHPEGIVADTACGGHPSPLVLRADGSAEPAGSHGSLIGVLETVDVCTSSVLLRPGDSIVAVTDGVLEARDRSGAFFGEDGLLELLRPLGGRSAAEVSGAVEARALELQAGVAHDDIAVLVAHIAATSSSPA
jgi:serine phosphatase RsbU (regulator of sigma subunit)